jgi:hypothetical protein
VDVAETAGGYRDVLRRYLDVAVILARWQPRQAFAQAVTSLERPFQTYLEEIRRRVACLPG